MFARVRINLQIYDFSPTLPNCMGIILQCWLFRKEYLLRLIVFVPVFCNFAL